MCVTSGSNEGRHLHLSLTGPHSHTLTHTYRQGFIWNQQLAPCRPSVYTEPRSQVRDVIKRAPKSTYSRIPDKMRERKRVLTIVMLFPSHLHPPPHPSIFCSSPHPLRLHSFPLGQHFVNWPKRLDSLVWSPVLLSEKQRSHEHQALLQSRLFPSVRLTMKDDANLTTSNQQKLNTSSFINLAHLESNKQTDSYCLRGENSGLWL